MKKSILILSVIGLMVFLLVPFVAQAENSVSVTHDIFTNQITVEAMYPQCPQSPVSIQIVPDGTNTEELRNPAIAVAKSVYVNHIISDTSGKAVFKFTIDADEGMYLVRTQNIMYSEYPLEGILMYRGIDNCIDAWNGLVSSPEDNLDTVLNALYVDDKMILSLKTDKLLLKKIKEYSMFGEFTRENADKFIAYLKNSCERISELRSVLSEVESANNFSQIKPIVTDKEKADILGITQYLERYLALESTKLADKEVAGIVFEDEIEFAEAFLKGIEAAEDAQNNDSANKKPSGSSSSKDSTFVGGNSLGTGINQPVSEQTSGEIFGDLDSVPWAKDAINNLYANGIINGVGGGLFAPNENIRREEFVKMITLFMNLEIKSGDTKFDDVVSSAWYAPYVISACNAGYINGYSDTIFGVGDFISRQDVAVILYRACNITGTSDALSFDDEAQISEYAKEAVKSFSSLGVITGSDGRFEPQSKCTRAQAACMIYRISELMKEAR